jgi:hypothetical protein
MQTGMTLKISVTLHRKINCSWSSRPRKPLLAPPPPPSPPPPPPPLSPSRDIASTAIERIARTIGLGMVTAEPAGGAPAVSAGVGAVGSSAVGRRPATTAPVLQPRHQHMQTSEAPPSAATNVIIGAHPGSPRAPPRGAKLCIAIRACIPAIFRRRMRHLRLLIIQAKYGTFAARNRVVADPNRSEKVTP